MNLMKKWESLTLADDFVFSKVFQNEAVCRELLEYLLHIKIDHIEYLETQKTIDVSLSAKGIRLDVYVADSDRIYDVEMQTTLSANLPMRTRYYQSLIDIDSVYKGASYSALKESYIIFICLDDPFGHGLSSYTFENTCMECGPLPLNDKSHKVFYNASAYKKEKDSNVRSFLEYLKLGKADYTKSFTSRLQNLVESCKNCEPWRLEYMTLEMKLDERFQQGMSEGILKGISQGLSQGISQGLSQGISQGMSQGISQGYAKGVTDTAQQMKNNGVQNELIAVCTGLPLAEVEKLVVAK